MANEIQIFNNEKFGEVRVVVNGQNEPMFCLVDVCNALGIKNSRDVKTRLDEDDVVLTDTIDALGRIQQTTFVTESGLYTVILRSDAENAKPFRRWVTKEVLPSLRKYGTYSTDKSDIGELTKARAFAAQFVKNELRLSDASYLGLLQQVASPLGLVLPQYVPSQGVLKSASELLKDMGSTISAVKFNQMLEAQGYVETLTRPTAGGKVRKFKNITDKGNAYGENEVNPKNQKETQPHWYADRFGELYEIVTKL